MSRPKQHPKLVEAYEELNRLPENQRFGNPVAMQWICQMMEYAPDDLKKIMHEKAQEMGLLPEAMYVSEDGKPLYSAEQIAKQLGVPLKQVEADIQRMTASGENTFVHAGPTFRKQ